MVDPALLTRSCCSSSAGTMSDQGPQQMSQAGHSSCVTRASPLSWRVTEHREHSRNSLSCGLV